MNGAYRLCQTLEDLGADTVFGLPGTQNVGLFSALGASGLRSLVATSEAAAAFMANGYARASGRPGILLTIPGPGFTFALPGLAEAFLDSAPLVYIVGAPATSPGRRFQLQAIDQAAMAAPITKAVLCLDDSSEVDRTIREAYALSLEGEPGPVMVQVAPAALTGRAATAAPGPHRLSAPVVESLDEVRRRLHAARRPLIYAGLGASSATVALGALAERLRAPVLTTTSGRGALPETHPFLVPSDLAPSDALLSVFAQADLVLAVGVKFSHNGARGFRLQLGPDKLVHVDAGRDTLGANYTPGASLRGDVPAVLAGLVRSLDPGSSVWTLDEIGALKSRLAPPPSNREARIKSAKPADMAGFFAALGQALSAGGLLALDSGQHQMLARRHFRVLSPRSLLVPTNFQSMGYGIPAAIGAKLARPDQTAVALVGDGGFAMSGMELLTAVREGLDLVVIVFNDGYFGLIREQQVAAHGTRHGTALRNPDFAQMAAAVGARYVRLRGSVDEALHTAFNAPGVVLVEVKLRDPVGRRFSRFKEVIKARAKRFVGIGR